MEDSLRIARRVLATLTKASAFAAAAGGGALGGLGALVFVQGRLASQPPSEEERHVLDGLVNALDAGIGPSRVAWLGDSLAAGVGAETAADALPRLVADRVDGATRLHVFAEPGATSRDVVTHQVPALEALRFGLAEIGQRLDFVAVSIGANDIGALTSRRRFSQNIARICHAAEGSTVVFVSIPNLNDAIRLPHPLRAVASLRGSWLNHVLRQVGDRDDTHYVCVRTRPEWITKHNLAEFLSADRFHPSGKGYAVWADRVAAAMTAALALPVEPAVN